MKAVPGRAAPLAAGALVFNALVWGVSWWPFRELQAHGLHPLWATALMYLVIASGLFLLHVKAWRGLASYPQLWLLGAMAGLTNVGFNWAVTVGDVVRVVLLFYLMPACSVLVAWWLLGEKPTLALLLRLGLAMVGVLIVLQTPDSEWPVPQGAADWLALGGGLSFAVTNALLRKYGHTPGVSRMLAIFSGSGLMAAAAALAGMAWQVVPGPALQASGIPLLLALSLAFMAGNAAMQYGAARLAGGTTAIVMLTEILFASGSSAALGAAAFTPRILLGGSLIVLAALLAAMAPSAEKAQTGAKSARNTRSTCLPGGFFMHTDAPTIYDFKALQIDGRDMDLSAFKGKALLIVNTASQCGFTPQFAGLEELHRAYAGRGLVVLGFPCNQFGAQDPGSDSEIARFCQANYGVDFAMMSKVDVNGPAAHPLYQWLTAQAPGLLGSQRIKWNFTKFLVGKDGRVLKRYAPLDKPAGLARDIETALAA